MKKTAGGFPDGLGFSSSQYFKWAGCTERLDDFLDCPLASTIADNSYKMSVPPDIQHRECLRPISEGERS
jgi:hypothetical protein